MPLKSGKLRAGFAAGPEKDIRLYVVDSTAARAGKAVAVEIGGYLEFQTAVAGDLPVFIQLP
jgi:hypothetical protein